MFGRSSYSLVIAADLSSDTATKFSDYRSQYIATASRRSIIITTRDVSFRDDAIISAQNQPAPL